MEPNLNNISDARYGDVNIANFVPSYIRNQSREGQASPQDVLLAINRLMGMAPARTAMVGETPIRPLIPSEQAGKEASFIFDSSGANRGMPRDQQMALVQALMQKLGIF